MRFISLITASLFLSASCFAATVIRAKIKNSEENQIAYQYIEPIVYNHVFKKEVLVSDSL